MLDLLHSTESVVDVEMPRCAERTRLYVAPALPPPRPHSLMLAFCVSARLVGVVRLLIDLCPLAQVHLG